MTTVNNQQVNFLKLTQISRKNIDNGKNIVNNNTFNSSAILKSDDNEKVKYEIEGDFNLKDLNEIDDVNLKKEAEAKLSKIYKRAEAEAKAINDKMEKILEASEKEIKEKTENIEKSSKKLDELFDKQKSGKIIEDEKKELSELIKDHANSILSIKKYLENDNKIEQMGNLRNNYDNKYNYAFTENHQILDNLSKNQGDNVGWSDDAAALNDKYNFNDISNKLAKNIDKIMDDSNELYRNNKTYAESFKSKLTGTEYFKKYFEDSDELNKICQQPV